MKTHHRRTQTLTFCICNVPTEDVHKCPWRGKVRFNWKHIWTQTAANTPTHTHRRTRARMVLDGLVKNSSSSLCLSARFVAVATAPFLAKVLAQTALGLHSFNTQNETHSNPKVQQLTLREVALLPVKINKSI